MNRAACTLLVLLCAAAFAHGQELLTPELLWQLGRVGPPEVSPDGRSLVFPVTRYDLAKDTGNSDLWLLDTRTGGLRRLTTHEKSDSTPRFSPDGQRVGFLSARGGESQVYAIDLRGGEPVRLTSVKNGASNFDWSPDGATISFTARVRLDPELAEIYTDLPKAKARIIDHLLYRHWTEWQDGTYSHLFVQPVAGGAPRDLMEGQRVDTPLKPHGGREQIAWSPDGRELCYTAKQVERPEASTDSDLYLVPADGGPARASPRAWTASTAIRSTPRTGAGSRSTAWSALASRRTACASCSTSAQAARCAS